MPARHIFTKEEREMFAQARKQNHNKNVKRRLRALQLYAEGGTLEEISKATEYHPAYSSHVIPN